MFFDIGWPELMLVGVVALVVIGPKDLPRALRVAGYWMRKARNMSREFQNSVDQMIREAELEDLRNDLKKATEFDLDHEFNRTIDPDGKLAESIRPPDTPDYFIETTTDTRPAAEAAPGMALPAAAALPEPEAAMEPVPDAAPQPAARTIEAIEADPAAAMPAVQPLPAKS